MPPDLAAGSRPLRRCTVIIVVALMLLIPFPGSTGASSAPTPRPASTSPHADGAVTDTSAQVTTSTSWPRQHPSADSSRGVLPLVLAAILFLALLVPATSYHSHGHWHPR